MIKKFVSNALLSVFMDKKARQKLQASRDSKSGKTAGSGRANAADNAPPYDQPVDGGDPIQDLDADEINELIRDSLNAAEQEISEKKVKRASNPKRQALIDEALAIHKSKKHIVDELPEEQRQKLLFMAQQALGAQLKGKK